MDKRFLIDGAVYKLEGCILKEEEVVNVLKIASRVINSINTNMSHQGFNPHAKMDSNQILCIYNKELQENGFNKVKLVHVKKDDDIIVEL